MTDIHIVMGNPDGLQNLLDLNTVISSNPNHIKQIANKCKVNNENNQHLYFVFQFGIQAGKDKQAQAYFHQAFNADINDLQKLSPLQKPFHTKPTDQSQGTVDFHYQNGKIIVKYKFNPTHDQISQICQNFEEQFTKYENFSLDTNISLKGQIKHNSKNRTNVKVDFVDFRISSDQIKPSEFTKITNQLGVSEQQISFLYQVPAYNMIGNLKRANFQMKLASFRALKSYYNKACHDKFAKQDKPFPYVNKGIFRKQANCYFLYKDKIALKAEANFNGEDVFMRLLKVYQALFKKLV